MILKKTSILFFLSPNKEISDFHVHNKTWGGGEQLTKKMFNKNGLSKVTWYDCNENKNTLLSVNCTNMHYLIGILESNTPIQVLVHA